jgi:hypothetical protein
MEQPWRTFERFARERMSAHYDSTLVERKVEGFPKLFDMVSDDGRIVGDAKYLTLVGGVRLPPAKFMEITGHVWMLELVPADHRFLVFGNQKRVAEWWLEKYGTFVRSVCFYFLEGDGKLDLLRKT